MAKMSALNIKDDSYDGNKDGKDDVLAAYNTYALAHNTNATVNEDGVLATFLQAVRNRAHVNGGSILLKSLVVTGKQTVVNGKKVSNPFATFGGTANRLLISPCFPVVDVSHLRKQGRRARSSQTINLIFVFFFLLCARTHTQDSDYNFQFIGVVAGLGGVFNVGSVNAPFAVSNFMTSGKFVAKTAKFSLLMDSFPNPNKLVGGTVDAGLKVGEVFFEKCTQHSYFQ